MKKLLSLLLLIPCAVTLFAAGEQDNSETVSGDPVPLKIVANYTQAELNPTDIEFFKAVEEATNTKIEFIIPPTSGYNEQVQLLLVSGDEVDAIMFKKTSDEVFQNAVKDSLVVPINQYLDNAPNLMEYTYDISWDGMDVLNDGDIYGIPRTSVARFDGFWVRKDWLQNVGLPTDSYQVLSVDDFTNILRKFTFEDPDRNGADDTYGMATYVDSRKVMIPVLQAELGYYGWQESTTGDYKYMDAQYDLNSDIYINVLKYTADVYSEGIIDPDSIINNGKASRERFWRGLTGVQRGFGGNYRWNTTELKKINPDADLVYIHVKNPENQVKGVAYGTSVWQFWSVHHSSKNPEKVVEIFDYMLSDEGYEKMHFGSEGVDYTVVDGLKTYTDEFTIPKARRNTVRRAGDSGFFITPDTEQALLDYQLPILEKSVQAVIRPLDRGYNPTASYEADYIDYQGKMDEIKSKIYMGEISVEAYLDVLQGWYANGGKAFVEEMNSYIAGKN